ncbi:unnamed protein product [Somion occarium]|uniref:RNase III domain-containing protein n=1 Tax=Somion occarium TaxID=3059160 RepID=A0ABP1CMB8_9APHY
MSKALSSSRAALHAFLRQTRPLETAVRLTPRLIPHRSRRPYGTNTPPRNAEQQNHTSSYISAKRPDPSRLVDHLNNVFQPLQFPPELAARILTHASHKDAIVSHNARLSFIGRRVLKTYLLLFLHSSPALHSAHDYELILERTLNTYVLGEHVAPTWSLGRVLKWSPVNISPQVASGSDYSNLDPKFSRSVGLYKVQGAAVEAVVGGVFHQYGGAIAHRLFHTRILPHLLLPGRPEGLHDAFHPHALDICERMGGVDGPLITTGSTSSTADLFNAEKSHPKVTTS